ncbi:M1 family metallopeptidase [Clostridium sp. Cult2]|uniref:M1 family metallopeptidase n=1 Tax=Clostridium sp. Cult2 TaxID=2079003 RepID=UPI001F2A6BE9|nr:peptidase M1 [Clostridium sp. Cult2]
MRRKSRLSIMLVLLILLSSFQLSFAVDLDNITKYDMTISLNTKEHILEGVQNVTFVNHYNNDLDEIVFHLYPNSFKSYETMPAIGDMYYLMDQEQPEMREEEKGYINIHKVHINRKEVEFKEDEQILKIPLEEPLKKGEKISIRIKFTLKVPEGYQRLHQMEGTYSLTNWYPILSIYDEKVNKWDENPYHPIGESNYSDVSDYNVKLTIPKEMVVAPTGTIVKEKVFGENKTLTIQGEKVRDFVILMSPNYKVKTKEVDGIKISNYYMKDKDYPVDKTAEIVLDEVAKAVKLLNNTIGKYPYDELRIAETYLSGGAMEYPQVIQMGGYHDLSNLNIEENAPFIIEAVVHETIHQWWYVGVGNDEFNEPFLDESLTVFTTAYYFEKEYDKYHRNGVIYSIRTRVYPSTILSLSSSVDKFNDWGDYSQTIYTRGPAFFEDLRQRVGEEKFIEILQEYYDRYLFKNATTEDLLDVIEEIAGKEIRKIMDKAVNEPNYFPQNIQLSEEENNIFYRRQEEQRLTGYEKARGLVLGSIALRGLEGEEIILVKPDYVKDGDLQDIESLINMLTSSLEMRLNIKMKVVEETKITDKEKEENIIIIGYPKKNSLLKEMTSKLPIDLNSDELNINGVSIENKNTSGIFISENPNNNKKVSLIIFLDENKAKKEHTITPDGYILDMNTIYNYNPLYNPDIQFIINIGDIEIRGMYK